MTWKKVRKEERGGEGRRGEKKKERRGEDRRKEKYSAKYTFTDNIDET